MPLTAKHPEKEDLKLYGTEMLAGEYRTMYQVENNFWWYRVMRQNLFVLLKKHWDWAKNPEPVILDAGCGTGANLKMLRGNFGSGLNSRFGKGLNTHQAWGFDVSKEAISFCRERGLVGRIVQASITEIPFPANSFDIALSFDVLNNLPDDRLAFNEIARVLRPGGLFILNLPACQFLFGKHDQAIGGRRRYNRDQVARHFREVGMEIERATYLNTFLFPPAALVRLLNKGTSHTEAQSDLTPPPALINNLLTSIMSLEAKILDYTSFNLPFGLSVMTLARKL